MRITAEQHEALVELGRSTCRPSPEVHALETKGLAVTGRGRFGDWARITEAGRAKLESLVGMAGVAKAGRTPRGAPPLNHASGAKQAETTPPVVSTRHLPPASSLQVGASSSSGEEPAERARGRRASVRKRPSPTSTGHGTETVLPTPAARVPPARKAGAVSHPQVKANAVRLLRGDKVSYYPLNMLGVLNGTCCKVKTDAKHFSTRSLAASAGDVVVR